MASDRFIHAQGAQPLVAPSSHEQTEIIPALWRDSLFWLTLALTIFAAAPFLLPGYFWGANDARHHVYFLFEYDRVVQDGVWWPRWSPDFAFGYGYPFFNIYGPFSHFLAVILLRFFAFTYTGAIEAIFVTSIVASAATMYAFVRSWAGRQAAVVAALVYVYIPYHLLNLYVRANLAESMALAWLPLCLWGVRQAVLRRSFGWVLTTAVAYAGLVFTSNLILVLFSPFLGLYLLVVAYIYAEDDVAPGTVDSIRARIWRWIQRVFPAALGLLAGVGLSAAFWLPVALERQFVRQDQWFDGRYDFRGNFVYFFQLFSPRWGFGVSQAGPDDPIGFQLGVAAVVLAVLGVTLVWRWVGKLRLEIGFFVATALITTFLTLQIAVPLWELPVIGSILGFAQFPWRWLSVAVVCISVLSGLVMHPTLVGNRTRLDLPLLAVIAVILVSGYGLLQVEIREPAEGPVSLAGLMRFQQSSDEMTGSTAWVKEIPTWSDMADRYISLDKAGEPVTPVETKVDYDNLTYPLDYKTFALGSVAHNTIMEEVFFYNEREDEQRIVFNHFFYPGWKAYLLDGEHGAPVQELPIIPEEEGTLGRMTVPLPNGEGFVLLRYEETPPRVVGKFISLITFGLLLVYAVVRTIRRRSRQTPHGRQPEGGRPT